MYCKRLKSADKSAEFVPYAENVILLWNSSGTFWN